MDDNSGKKNGKGKQEKEGGAEESSADNKRFKLPSFAGGIPPGSSKDPLTTLQEIAKDKDIDPEIRQWLFEYSVSRFSNRRKMAYIALMTIVGIVFFLVFGALYDGVKGCVEPKDCVGILASVQKIEDLLVWVVGFLASIVAAYYGASSFRPSS